MPSSRGLNLDDPLARLRSAVGGVWGGLSRTAQLARAAGPAVPDLIRSRPDRDFSVADAVSAMAERRGDHPALVSDESTITYRELEQRSNQVAHWVATRDPAPTGPVALYMGNRPEYVVWWLGLAKAGLVTALVNTNLTDRALAHSIDVAEADLVVVDVDLADSWATAIAHLSTDPPIVRAGDGADSIDAAVASQPTEPVDDRRADHTAGDDLFLIYTSGTTGLPKAAHFSHQRFMATTVGARALARLRPHDRLYVPLPLYHTAGGVMAVGGALTTGATAIVPPKFSARRFWDDCVRHDATVFQYIGELCRYLLHTDPHPLEREHQIRLCYGNGLRPEVWEAFQQRFGIDDIVEFYGATEGTVTLANLDGTVGSIGRLNSVLRRAMGVHLILVDPETEEPVRGPDGFCIDAGSDRPGEAIGRLSETLRFEGYTDAEASDAKLLRDVFEPGDCFYRTGDLLQRDRRGNFTFVDRLGDTFRWKGENVSTGEVGAVLAGSAGVTEVNVYGVDVPDADGRAGMASLVVDESTFTVDELQQVAHRGLAAYARPRFLRIRTHLDTTGTFKYRKVEAVAEGFDPSLIDDPLYVLDGDQYLELDTDAYLRVVSGELRL